MRTAALEDGGGGLTLLYEDGDDRRAWYLGQCPQSLEGSLVTDLVWIAHDPGDCDLDPVDPPDVAAGPGDTTGAPQLVGEYRREYGRTSITLYVPRMGRSALAYAGLQDVARRYDLT